MSRFLARALAMVDGPARDAPASSPAPRPTSGDCGDFGERLSKGERGGAATTAPPASSICGVSGGIGERAESEPVAAAAARLSSVVREHGPGHPEAQAAARALLAACRGVADDPEERMCAPAWAEVTAEPPPGAWCGCCGRREKRGGRWWRERHDPKGWRCATCHPPDHLDARDVMEMQT